MGNPELNRKHYHDLLDQAMNEAKEGEFIGAKFSQLLFEELKNKMRILAIVANRPPEYQEPYQEPPY